MRATRKENNSRGSLRFLAKSDCDDAHQCRDLHGNSPCGIVLSILSSIKVNRESAFNDTGLKQNVWLTTGTRNDSSGAGSAWTCT